jgi:hypothetical protein
MDVHIIYMICGTYLPSINKFECLCFLCSREQASYPVPKALKLLSPHEQASYPPSKALKLKYCLCCFGLFSAKCKFVRSL